MATAANVAAPPLAPSETSPLLINRSLSQTDIIDTGGIVRADDATRPSDEEALLSQSTTPTEAQPEISNGAVFRIVCVLLLAVFIFNADGSLVLATHPIIASEFDALTSSSWLFTGFGLAGAATQTTFGKLSDIYGRKPIILFCYTFFAVGCIIVGLGQSMFVVILGRVLSGSVGAGMTVLVSLLITDLVPLRDTAAWRAYVNVAATTGRSLGGPLGGWLADVVSWRWSFLGQAPILLLAIILCVVYLPNTGPKKQTTTASTTGPNSGGRLSRVDFAGSATLGAFILSLLLPLEIGGTKVPWTHPVIPALLVTAAVLLVVFVAIEKWWAKEPIIPLELFANREVVASYAIIGLQVAAQVGLMFSIPLYFQVTKKVSNTEAGAHLFPAVAGNAVGGILSGLLIRKSGKYKWLVSLATLSSSLCYTLLLFRWHGDTNWWESLYIIPGGFGTGIAQSVTFIALQAAVEPAHMAPAISTLYLSSIVGSIVGLACISATTQSVLRYTLSDRLHELGLDPARQREILERAVSNVNYIYQVRGKISAAVVASYVDGIWYTHVVSLVFSLSAFLIGFALREHKLAA